MGFSKADTEDITQATWILIWRHVRHVNHARGLPSWLILPTAREASRFGKKMRRQVEQEGLAAESSGTAPGEDLTSAEVERLETIQQVRDAIVDLSGRCADLLTLTDLQEMAYKEVAKCLKMPLGSIGPTRLRCMAKLLELFRSRGLA